MNNKTFTNAGRTVTITASSTGPCWKLTIEFPELSPEEIKAVFWEVGNTLVWRTQRTFPEIGVNSVPRLCAAARHLGKSPKRLWKEILDELKPD